MPLDQETVRFRAMAAAGSRVVKVKSTSERGRMATKRAPNVLEAEKLKLS